MLEEERTNRKQGDSASDREVETSQDTMPANQPPLTHKPAVDSLAVKQWEQFHRTSYFRSWYHWYGKYPWI
ncbi:hypothetical protein [Cohnella soli]|uniref:Uncharacterized protein n=1 Tax=Cohnella soli TaxID=425005 RepID=A0ABW0I373_9BACL